jgi:4-aminobutyrate aminotransferase/(S)-3-amino-2-methylpropionate transaminase
VSIEASFAALEHLFRADIEPARLAALIIEPVQGEGGFYIAPAKLLRRLRDLCDRHGIVFIADEIQTGFGRTGKMFAIEHSGVKPDLITVAKSLAGGFPLAGVIGRAEIMDAPEAGGLGGTYGGSPIGCAAALGVLDVIERDGLVARSARLGEHIVGRIRKFAARTDMQPIGDIRNLGGMLAFELVKARGGHAPDAEATKTLCAKALANGLILLSCGVFGNAIRILVPLTATDKIVDEGLDIIERCLAEMAMTAAQAAE